MKVMAYTMSGKFEEIRIEDCPITIAPNAMAAIEGEDTSLYFADTVILYDEVNNIAEGDVISDKQSGLKGVIYYNAGWRIHWSNGDYSNLTLSDYIELIKRIRKPINARAVRNIEQRSEVTIVAEEEEYPLTMLLGKYDSLICISGKPQLVNKDEIYLSTGIYSDNGTPIYFNQFYKGGVVGLDKDMRVCAVCSDKNIILED